jgi:eukaryotic-like serine/threonine-protein kinase
MTQVSEVICDIHRHRLTRYLTVSETAVQEMLREIALQSSLSHPNLAALKGLYADDDGVPKYFLMEYADGGDLYRYLSKLRRPLTFRELYQFCEEILKGLEHLHTQNPPIIHRDIKPGNILVYKSNTSPSAAQL